MASIFFDPKVIVATTDYLVISKPAGLMVHGDGVFDGSTLVDWLLQHYPEIKGVGEDWHTEKGGKEITIQRPGIVHRLDRDTSGIMIVARTQEFFEYIKKELQEHRIVKTYRAYVYGHVKQDRGTINAAIGRSATDIRKWSAGRGARGQLREAITEYNVLGRVHDNHGEAFTSIEFHPKTGRTHQIRVHAKYMNHPIVGDVLYAGKLIERGSSDNTYALGFSRQALHAYRVAFHDREGVFHEYEAPLPEDFINAEKSIAEKGR